MNAETYLFNKKNSLPLYIQVANWIRAKVVTGEWPEGYKLPPEVDLAKDLQISRGTLRHALSILIENHIIEQTHGKGTFVGSAILEQNWAYKLTTTSEELNWMGIPFETEVLKLTQMKVSDERIISLLHLKPEQEIIFLRRLRRIAGLPVVLHETYFPAAMYPGLLKIDFTNETMTGTLENTYDLSVTRADHTISAIYADQSIASILEINHGEPIIYDEHVLFNANDVALEFTKGYFRGDRFRLKTVVYRDQASGKQRVTG
ncbi:MAG: GntR family transcriptional regulator [Anaerolineales bacterium]|nr:GntR family transcriptional regulator [Anaerolineales bacterium]